VTCDEGVTPVTWWSHHITVMVTRLYDIEKIIEDSRTDDIIQYDKSMLAL